MTTGQAAEPLPEAREERGAVEVVKRFVQGDLASLRVFVVLAVIWIIFQLQNSNFLTANNLTNLFLQITAVGLISVGIVYVLLLGEIDLSVGALSGLAAAIMAVLQVKHGWNPYLAVAAGVLTGMIIGLFQGTVFAYFGVPAFIVTLAGLLAWQGALLYVLGDTGTINITNGKLTGLANTLYGETASWNNGVVVIVLYGAANLWGYRRRVAAGLPDQAIGTVLLRIGVLTVPVIVAIAIFNQDRGLPLAALILGVFVAGFQYLISRPPSGRHIFAGGGNIAAARGAGLRLGAIRISVFALAGALAAVGGIMGAARQAAAVATTVRVPAPASAASSASSPAIASRGSTGGGACSRSARSAPA